VSPRPRLELTSRVFGRLTVTRFAGLDSRRNSLWECLCTCGKNLRVLGWSLVGGHSKSCGCNRPHGLKKGHQISVVHGHARREAITPTWITWEAMWQRCTNSKRSTWKYYGGRGITICERWKTFTNFLSDMGERPKGKTLDRYPDPDGNYEPGNCRWATPSEQRRNQRPKAPQSQPVVMDSGTASTHP
jgi:hypothetical protein